MKAISKDSFRNSLFVKCTCDTNPVNIYLIKVNIRNTSKRCEICSKLILKTLKQRQRRRFSVFIVDLSTYFFAGKLLQ